MRGKEQHGPPPDATLTPDAAEPRSRERRVEKLREQVRNGTYEVDSKELAKALIKRHTASGKR